jgi:hypothetical protein
MFHPFQELRRMGQDVLRAGAMSAAGRGTARVAAVLLMLALVTGASLAHSPQIQPPATPAASEADAAGLPPARSVIDRHVVAIGGADALRRHDSMHLKGRLTMPAAGISGTLDAYAARPNKSLLKVSLDGVGEVTEGFDGRVGWSVSPLTGPMLLEGRQLEEKRFDAEYDNELRKDGRYVSITTVERTEFEGRPCYKIRLVRAIGGEDIEFYDVETGLKAGGITTRETPMGTVTGTTVETDYRPFGSLLHPTTVRSRVGAMEQVVTITSVEYDSVRPSVFEMPPDIRALLQ